MIKINEWVEDYYTYGRLNSHGFCSLEDLEHSLDQVQWDKDKAIDYVMWNHNIEKDQATGMIEWAMSMLTMPGFVHPVETPEAQESAAAKVRTIIQDALNKHFDRVEICGDNYHQRHSNVYVSGDILQQFFYHFEKAGGYYADFDALHVKRDSFTADITLVPAITDTLIDYIVEFEGLGKDNGHAE